MPQADLETPFQHRPGIFAAPLSHCTTKATLDLKLSDVAMAELTARSSTSSLQPHKVASFAMLQPRSTSTCRSAAVSPAGDPQNVSSASRSSTIVATGCLMCILRSLRNSFLCKHVVGSAPGPPISLRLHSTISPCPS